MKHADEDESDGYKEGYQDGEADAAAGRSYFMQSGSVEIGDYMSEYCRGYLAGYMAEQWGGGSAT